MASVSKFAISIIRYRSSQTATLFTFYKLYGGYLENLDLHKTTSDNESCKSKENIKMGIGSVTQTLFRIPHKI